MAKQTEEKEIGKSCGECKKALKRSKRYYREGDYFCNKNCYKKRIEKIAKEAEEKLQKPAEV